MKAQHKQLAFTLSELLVSLSVLGLIAALTLPSILNGANQGNLKTRQREAINAVQNMVYEGYMNGEFASLSNYSHVNSSDPLVALISSKLNARQCPKGQQAAPCDHNHMNEGESHTGTDHSARWVLPTGVHVWLWGNNSTSSFMTFTIDAVPGNTSTRNTAGADTMWLLCNISEVPLIITGVPPIRPGQCGAWNSGHQTTISALYQ